MDCWYTYLYRCPAQIIKCTANIFYKLPNYSGREFVVVVVVVVVVVFVVLFFGSSSSLMLIGWRAANMSLMSSGEKRNEKRNET